MITPLTFDTLDSKVYEELQNVRESEPEETKWMIFDIVNDHEVKFNASGDSSREILIDQFDKGKEQFILSKIHLQEKVYLLLFVHWLGEFLPYHETSFQRHFEEGCMFFKEVDATLSSRGHCQLDQSLLLDLYKSSLNNEKDSLSVTSKIDDSHFFESYNENSLTMASEKIPGGWEESPIKQFIQQIQCLEKTFFKFPFYPARKEKLEEIELTQVSNFKNKTLNNGSLYSKSLGSSVHSLLHDSTAYEEAENVHQEHGSFCSVSLNSESSTPKQYSIETEVEEGIYLEHVSLYSVSVHEEPLFFNNNVLNSDVEKEIHQEHNESLLSERLSSKNSVSNESLSPIEIENEIQEEEIAQVEIKLNSTDSALENESFDDEKTISGPQKNHGSDRFFFSKKVLRVEKLSKLKSSITSKVSSSIFRINKKLAPLKEKIQKKNTFFKNSE